MRTILFLLTGFFAIFNSHSLKACSEAVWGEDYRYHLMFPESLGKGPIMPFHFSSAYWYSHPFEFEELGIDKNCREWALTDGNRHSQQEWKRALYGMTYSEILAANDSFIQGLLGSIDMELKNTFLFVKKIEGLYEEYSPWVCDNRLTEPNKLKLLEEGKDLYEKTKSRELRCRIAYQLVRLAWGTELMDVYQTYLKPVQSYSITGVWVLRQLAGYHVRMGDKAQANLLLARLFVQADEWKYWAFENYNKGIVEECLKKAETSEDRESVLVLDALSIPTKALEKLQKLYTLYPDNPLIDMLLMREINKMEDLLYTPAFTQNRPAIYEWWYSSDDSELPNYFENKLYAKRLKKFIWKEATGRKRQSAFWNLAAAYMAMLDSELSLANRFLEKSKTCPGFSAGIEIQWLTLKALYTAKDTTLTLSQKREKVAGNFLTLRDKLGDATKATSVLSNLALVLANTFDGAGDRMMAAYCFGHTKHFHQSRFWLFYQSNWSGDEYPGESEGGYLINNWAGSMQFFFYLEQEVPTSVIKQILNHINSNDLSESMRRFMEPVFENRFRVYDLVGTRHFIEKNYEAALQAYDKIPDIWWDTCNWEIYSYIPDNPFNSPIEYIRSPIGKVESGSRSNKCIIADSVYRWEKMQAQTSGNEAAVYQFKIANLLLNTTYAGDAWAMTRYWRSLGDDFGDYTYSYQKGIEQKLDKDYFDYDLAKSWYLKAYQNSSDPLMRASSLARAAWCEDDSPFYFENVEDRHRKARINKFAPSLQKLLKEYPDMAASVYSGCPGFDAFFARR